MSEIARRIEAEVGSWPGVVVQPHQYGGVEFRVDGHEIGHLHGGRMADLPFPRRVRDELVAAGRAEPHHVLPQTGWVTRRIHGEEDVPEVVELFRINHERVRSAKRARQRVCRPGAGQMAPGP